ncbi:MAG: hypothetical protein ABJK59_02325 [Erythrobacter sp.]|uniref:hypothetical protein n=1 Tax=Erythrobacter sp. TaxID=1042 RepID=UPI003296FA91
MAQSTKYRSFLGYTAGFSALSIAITASASVQEASDSEESPDGNEIVVVGNQEPYFQLGETATKSNRDLLNTPLCVTILNKNFLDDLRAETLADAYPYTVGLSQSGTNANSFTLRGLSSSVLISNGIDLDQA